MQDESTSATVAADFIEIAEPVEKAKRRDTRKWEKTQTPGILKRTNKNGTCIYAVVFRAEGKQVKELASTQAEARRLKAARTTDVARNEFQEQHRITFRDYLSEWIDRYQGKRGSGFREASREEYRRLLDNYAHAYFPERKRLVDVRTVDLSRFVGWLCDERTQGKVLSDKTVANILIPLRAALSTAKQEGMLRINPADGLALPTRTVIREDDDDDVRALSRAQLHAFLSITPADYRVLFHVLASTGLRISEAIGLQRRDFHLDDAEPHLRVRRAIVRGREDSPKSQNGRRKVALPADLVALLRTHLSGLNDDGPEAVAFPNRNGKPLDPDNLRHRILKPLMEEVGAPWAAFHALRHTYASIQLAEGVSIVQLSRAMGHASAAFTLDRYVHLLPGEGAPALDLGRVLATEAEHNPVITVGQQWGNEPSRIETHPIGQETERLAS
jgi:integrase